jgi:hypothetical protein
MEISQAKMSFFSFSLFSLTKLENRRSENVLWGAGEGSSGREVIEKGGRRVKKMCKRVCKCKNDTC